MGRVILLTQQKGGAGKTTVLTSLAAHLAGQGAAVSVLDLDPQGSTLAWARARAARAHLAPVDVIESAEWRARSDISEAARGRDWVLVDAPGSADTLGKTAMRAADFALIPCQPSAADVWATEATLDNLRATGLEHAIVFNRVPPRSRVAEAAMIEAEDLGAPILDARLGARAVFAEAFMTGRGAGEMPRAGRAAEELSALAAAVTARVAALV
ncbi:MAG: ParA family partition ATPase [Pseudomonadota bacterium]